jgi:serine/threonine protein kinase
MDAQRWSAIDELFQAALAADRSERARVLADRAGEDVELRQEVESLLVAHERASTLLDAPVFDASPRASAASVPASLPGKRIGKYTLRGVIGHGGSGIVYEAEQDEPSRIVALKVLRAAPLADEWAPRLFRREAEALARLQHPGIATVYEAGLQDEGSYYFAMERVEGRPITEFVRDQGLAVRRRLEIFQAVCDAVHYAHQHGVIHRDLKPSNILVTPSGRPKVLDFGLARITDPDRQHTQITEIGVFQGTLAYASPEQIHSPVGLGGPGGVDLRCDVYSLGVVLFEVLTGARPYEIQGLTLPDAARVICEEPPRSLAAVAPALRGDLATIVHKAIEKDAEQRYRSAAALGEDIARFLAREPILAHPPSTTYQLRRLVARHRVPFAIAGAAFALLLGLSVWLQILYFRSRASERLAEQRAAISGRVKDFMLDVVATHHPDVLQGEKVSTNTLLHRALLRIDADLRSEPLLHAELLHSLGKLHKVHGDFAEAETLFQQALDLRVRHLGEADEAVAHTRVELGETLKYIGRPTEALAQFEAALSALEALHGPRHESVAIVLGCMAETLRDSDPERAVSLYDQALDIRRELLGDDHPITVQTLADVGVVQTSLGDPGADADRDTVGWIVNPANGHEYRLTTGYYWGASDTSAHTPPDWMDAEAEAVARGGHLVTINDAAENSWLVSTFGGNVHQWIGLTDLGSEGAFYWASGEPVTFLNWDTGTGQPDNAHTGGEDTVHTNHYFGATPGSWNDLGARGNTSRLPYRGIIEREGTPPDGVPPPRDREER